MEQRGEGVREKRRGEEAGKDALRARAAGVLRRRHDLGVGCCRCNAPGHGIHAGWRGRRRGGSLEEFSDRASSYPTLWRGARCR
eukprot:4667011-Pyramimonas_sp.AAC.2